MNRRMLSLLILAALLGLTLAMGCSSARMALPDNLKESATMMACKGRGGFDESFTMGPYQIVDVKRGWTRKSAWGLLGYSSSNTRQQFEYSMITPEGVQWQGQATTNLRQKELEGETWGGKLEITLSDKENLVARCSGPSSWTLVLTLKSSENLFAGIYNSGNQTYEIQGTHKLAGSLMPLNDASGYLISRSGEVVAAVEVINAGAVWMSTKLSSGERDQLAAAAAALLLYQDLDS